MNKILLIGNGFDLHNGLKSSYRDFIEWLLNKVIMRENLEDVNELITFTIEGLAYPLLTNLHRKTLVNEILAYNFQNEEFKYETPDSYNRKCILIIKLNSKILHYSIKHDSPNWGDFEFCYYLHLKNILNEYHNGKNILEIKEDLRKLNTEFEIIKKLLNIYLKEISKDKNADTVFRNYLGKEIRKDIFTNKSIIDKIQNENPELSKTSLIAINDIKILNFNYTNLFGSFTWNSNVEQIHIHGQLNNNKNPMIFGYGDEMDEDYSLMEKSNINEFLTNIKSFGYLMNSNYQKLISFISSDYYVIEILGHSCNLTDRTLLNMLFEHENCIAIKPYYWEKHDGSDNYLEITQNISRHFNNKTKMRLKIVNKEHCKPLGS